jgi:hypothetical protein
MTSETIRQWILTLSVATLALVALSYMLKGLVHDAQAQEANGGKTAVCDGFSNPKKYAPWMTEQLNAGRDNFITFEAWICAW